MPSAYGTWRDTRTELVSVVGSGGTNQADVSSDQRVQEQGDSAGEGVDEK